MKEIAYIKWANIQLNSNGFLKAKGNQDSTVYKGLKKRNQEKCSLT